MMEIRLTNASCRFSDQRGLSPAGAGAGAGIIDSGLPRSLAASIIDWPSDCSPILAKGVEGTDGTIDPNGAAPGADPCKSPQPPC